jgi:hypothetical protein
MSNNVQAGASAFLLVAGLASLEYSQVASVFAIVVGCLGVYNLFTKRS